MLQSLSQQLTDFFFPTSQPYPFLPGHPSCDTALLATFLC